MNYKSIIFCTLLTRVLFTSCSQDSLETKIQQAKQAHLQKAYELSELGKKIAAQYKVLEGFSDEIVEHLIKIARELKIEDRQALEEFKQKLIVRAEQFSENIQHEFNTKKGVTDFLLKELFDKREFLALELDNEKFDILKFTFIRIVVEMYLLEGLVSNYADCLQALIDIDHEIDQLLEQSAQEKGNLS